MKIKEIIKGTMGHVEVYLARKVKFDKQTNTYLYEKDSLINLDNYNKTSNFGELFERVRHYLNLYLDPISKLEIYNTRDCNDHYLSVDSKVHLGFVRGLEKQLCTPSLVEADSVSYNYLMIKAKTRENEDFIVWLKLKKAVKVIEQQFNNLENEYTLIIKDTFVESINDFKIDVDIADAPFMYYRGDMYVMNPPVYQAYFNLDTTIFSKASDLIYNCDSIISDGEIVVKSKAKKIVDTFEQLTEFFTMLNNGQIAPVMVKGLIDDFKMNITYNEEDHKFIVRTSAALDDLIAMATGCIIINKVNDRKIRIKNPKEIEEV